MSKQEQKAKQPLPEQPEEKFVSDDELESLLSDVPIEEHFIPEFKGKVWIRALDTDQIKEFGELVDIAEKKKKPFNAALWLFSQFMVDANGKPRFSYQRLKSRKRSLPGVRRVNAIGQRMSGIGKDAQEELKRELESDPLDGSDAELRSKLESLLD